MPPYTAVPGKAPAEASAPAAAPSTTLQGAALALGLRPSPSTPCSLWVSAVDAFSTQYGAGVGHWGAANVVGPPSVYPRYGDISTAWAPRAAAGGAEFLEVSVADAVLVSEVHVYETNAPGALVRVLVKTAAGDDWVLAATRQAKQTSSGAVLNKVRLAAAATALPATKLRLEFDTTGFSDWYEIDAIAVVGCKATAATNAPWLQPAPPAGPEGALARDLLKLLQSNSGDHAVASADGGVLRLHSALVAVRCPALLLAAECVPEATATLNQVARFVYTGSIALDDETVGLAIPLGVAAARLHLPALEDLACDALAAALAADTVAPALGLVRDVHARMAGVCRAYIAANLPRMAPAALATLHPADLVDVLSRVKDAYHVDSPKADDDDTD